MKAKMESVVKSALSFSAIAGDQSVRDVVWNYLYGPHGVFDLLDECMPLGKYGEHLELILIMLHIEGEFDWFRMPDKARLGRYSAKHRAITYDVPIVENNFFYLSHHARREFLLQQMYDAVEAARVRCSKKRLAVDFETMLIDLDKVARAYRLRPLVE